MKKLISVNVIFVLMLLCGCSQENSDVRFMLDTVVSLSADCNSSSLEGAFDLCGEYEKLLSRTKADSDISRINASNGEVSVSSHTEKIVRRGIYYGEISNGKFDITICPVSELWDYKNQTVPSRDEIAEALKNVDYQRVSVSSEGVNSGGTRLDLGGIAKGYIADRLAEYLKQNGAENGKVDLGGNLVVFGSRRYNIGLKKPFSENELVGTLRIKNKSVVTSGVYERYIKSGDNIYHHIVDPNTGYPCTTDLAAATIIGDSSMDCDALSTVCILLGKKKATELIENTKGTEAVFIDHNGKITHTSGIKSSGGIYSIK